jgi:hypothetical protein
MQAEHSLQHNPQLWNIETVISPVALIEQGDTMTPPGMNTAVARTASLRLGWLLILDRG